MNEPSSVFKHLTEWEKYVKNLTEMSFIFFRSPCEQHPGYSIILYQKGGEIRLGLYDPTETVIFDGEVSVNTIVTLMKLINSAFITSTNKRTNMINLSEKDKVIGHIYTDKTNWPMISLINPSDGIEYAAGLDQDVLPSSDLCTEERAIEIYKFFSVRLGYQHPNINMVLGDTRTTRDGSSVSVEIFYDFVPTSDLSEAS